MKRISFLLLVILLSACGGLPKQGAAQAQYDFGIAAIAPSPIEFRIGSVESPPGLSSSDMRYRLAYQNPMQLFAYTESRWAATPAELVSRRMQQRWLSSAAKPCNLQLTLESFDQVFDTAASSRAVVQLRANFVTARHQSTALMTVEQPATSADARGGVAALIKATDEALEKSVAWANAQECAAKPKD